MSLTNAAAAGVLDQVFRGVAFAAAGTPFAALATNGGAEVTGTGYARIAAPYGAATAASPSVVTATEIDFGTVGGDWTASNVDEVRFYSALSGGTELWSDTDTAIAYVAGNRAFVASGSTFSFGDNGIFLAAYAQTIADWLANSGTAPAQLTHLGLLNSGTELSGGNYARLDVSSLWAAATVADPSVLAFSGGAATFIASATFTGTVNQLGLFTASTGGVAQCTLAVAAQTIAASDQVTVNPTITLT